MTQASCWALMRFAISRRCCTTGALDRGHAAMGRPLDHARLTLLLVLVLVRTSSRASTHTENPPANRDRCPLNSWAFRKHQNLSVKQLFLV
jgi:hypothetical protein